jgi:hypothetical protein
VSLDILRSRLLTVPLIASLLWPAPAASRAKHSTSAGCDRCVECVVHQESTRVVRLKIYKKARVIEASLARMIETANRIWAAYGVTVETTTSMEGISVWVSDGTPESDAVPGPQVLGTTMFTNGHSMPLIRLWWGAANALAESAPFDGKSFDARTLQDRDRILQQIMGVALAHELAHYLLDTTQHSHAGLMQVPLSIRDLAEAEPARLSLTMDEQRRLCERR